MASKSRTTEAIEVSEIDLLPQYQPDLVLDEINEKFGSLKSYSNITLYRRSEKGEFLILTKYNDTLPDISDIIAEYGGGAYKLYIQFYNNEGERKMITRSFSIEGPAKIPGKTETAQQVQQNNSTDFLDTLIKMKAAGLIGSENKDTSLIIETMKSNTEMMKEVIKNSRQEPPAADTTAHSILDKIFPLLLERGSETPLDNYLKIKKIVEAEKPASDDDSILKSLLPIVAAKFLQQPETQTPAVIPATGQKQFTPGKIPEQINPGSGPGNSETAQIKEAILTMAKNIDQSIKEVRADIAMIGEKVNTIDDFLSEEDEYLVFKNDTANVHEINETEPLNHTGNEFEIAQNASNEAEKREDNPEMLGKLMKAADLNTKVKLLKEWNQKKTIEQIFAWCLVNGAVENLQEFNEIVKAAELPEYVPPVDPNMKQ